MGGRVGLNLTLFRMDWEEYQVEVVDPEGPYSVAVINVGDAEIEGLSLDFNALLWDSLDVGLNLQLLDARDQVRQ